MKDSDTDPDKPGTDRPESAAGAEAKESVKKRRSRATRTTKSSAPEGEPAPKRTRARAETDADAADRPPREPSGGRASRRPRPEVEDEPPPKFSLSDLPKAKSAGEATAPSSHEASSETGGRGDGRPAPPRYAVSLDENRIDPDVQKVVRRLVRHGYEAYLVGGCVRDLLLDGKPKDFDVATSARPEQVRELFRNSRVIGRRFRLVHVLFHGGKVIEVATFRRNPNDESDDAPGEGARRTSDPRDQGDHSQLLIRSDNVFGEAHEDAARRDFTINALFYDVEAGQMLDWVGGLDDIARRVVNTIGEPHVRFREDPVRILRALKFAGRLNLGIVPEVYDAIVDCRDALDLAARPRVAEEVMRLLRGGGARRTIYLAWETGVLDVLLPELAALLYDSFGSDAADGPGHRVFRLLEHIDQKTRESGPRDDTVLWTLLLLEPLKEATEGARDRGAAAVEFLEPLLERLAIPRRFADGMRRILSVLPRILSGRAGRFARTELFDLALEVAEADLYARGRPLDVLEPLRVGGVKPAPDVRPSRGARDDRPRRPLSVDPDLEADGASVSARAGAARSRDSRGRGAAAGRSRPTPRH